MVSDVTHQKSTANWLQNSCFFLIYFSAAVCVVCLSVYLSVRDCLSTQSLRFTVKLHKTYNKRHFRPLKLVFSMLCVANTCGFCGGWGLDPYLSDRSDENIWAGIMKTSLGHTTTLAEARWRRKVKLWSAVNREAYSLLRFWSVSVECVLDIQQYSRSVRFTVFCNRKSHRRQEKN